MTACTVGPGMLRWRRLGAGLEKDSNVTRQSFKGI
jgi:hypothetical protein